MWRGEAGRERLKGSWLHDTYNDRLNGFGVARNGQHVEFIVHAQARSARRDGQQKALVEARDDVLVCLGAQARVDVHGQRVQLLEGRQRFQEQHNDAAAFHGFDRAAQQVGRQGFKVLQHAHAVRVAEDLFAFMVVRPPHAGGGHERVKRVVAGVLVQAPRHEFFDLLHALLAVPA